MISTVKLKLDLIAECILNKIQQKEENFGLYTGGFGILLFLFYYSRYSKNRKYKLLTENYAEELLERFSEETNLHTFCSGFSGTLYLFEFLRENNFIDMNVDKIQNLLDNYLVIRMKQDIRQQNYDFMHGALGVGLYFIRKRTNPKYIQELIDFLYYTAEKDLDNKIFKWESIIEPEKKLIGYNLALSHGIPSIIIFLSRIIKSEVSDKKVIEMLSGAVNYVMLQQKDFSEFGSCFPSYLLKDSQNPTSKSRLAWCYGDLGIGISLWQAGKALKKTEWKQKGVEILLQSTKRQNYSDTLVIDAGICHGSAGIAMIYNYMFYETHQQEFKEATVYWLAQTLNFSPFEDGLAGYKSFVKDKWECDYSLLTGISGIGLVLLSYLKDKQQAWDEMFLLS